MPWARFEDDYLGNAKLTTLSTAAIALDMAAIIYSARELRDGLLRASDVDAIATLIHIRRWAPVAAELVAVNRWSVSAGGYAIHDYLEYQPSRQQVLGDRAAAAYRMRRVREKFARTSSERSDEVREKFADPGPGPGPGPERSTNVPGDPPTPLDERSDEVRANGGVLQRRRQRKPRAEPEPTPVCCPDFARTHSEHWAYCRNAPAMAEA